MNPEYLTNIVDFSDHRSVAVLFGDAVAAAVTSKQCKSAWHLIDSYYRFKPRKMVRSSQRILASILIRTAIASNALQLKQHWRTMGLLIKHNQMELDKGYFIGYQSQIYWYSNPLLRGRVIPPDKTIYYHDHFGNYGAATKRKRVSTVFSQHVVLSVVGTGLILDGLLFRKPELI